jgi:hypothetical protein
MRHLEPIGWRIVRRSMVNIASPEVTGIAVSVGEAVRKSVEAEWLEGAGGRRLGTAVRWMGFWQDDRGVTLLGVLVVALARPGSPITALRHPDELCLPAKVLAMPSGRAQPRTQAVPLRSRIASDGMVVQPDARSVAHARQERGLKRGGLLRQAL